MQLRFTLKFRVHHFLLNVLFTFFILVFSKQALAEYGLALGFGVNEKIYAVRLSLQIDSSLCLDNDIWPATGYWEGSANYLSMRHKHPQGPSNNHLGGVSLAYVVHFEKKDPFCLRNLPYVEFGLGPALFDNNEFNNRRLGSSGLIEVKIGAGMRFGEFKEYDLSYKFIHYSNANLAEHNDGINLNYLIFSYLF